MPHIAIISGSIRIGRKSHRVALYFKKLIEESGLGSAEILDLKEYNFPLFDERIKYQANPSEGARDFSARIVKADGVLLVTPEYNGGYPASVKNVVDLLYDEWQKKPFAISTASDGDFGGSQVITSLQFTLWKIHALIAPAMFPVPNVDKNYAEDGTPVNKEASDKRALRFLKELFWLIEKTGSKS